eukprot:2013955-Rhodomonas_salina.1
MALREALRGAERKARRVRGEIKGDEALCQYTEAFRHGGIKAQNAQAPYSLYQQGELSCEIPPRGVQATSLVFEMEEAVTSTICTRNVIYDKKNCEIAYQKLLFQYNLSEACGSLPLILPFLRSSAMVGAETAGCIGRERAQLREEEERVIKMGWSTS